MTLDCVFWAVAGGLVGVILGMFLTLCRIGRDLDDMYDTAFDSGVEYERENQQIAELLKKKEQEAWNEL